MNRTEMGRVSFRLPRKRFADLGRVADEEDTSVDVVARSMVLRALPGGESADSRQDWGVLLADLFAEVETLHQAFVVMQHRVVDVLETVLVNTTSGSPSQVRDWVRTKFPEDE